MKDQKGQIILLLILVMTVALAIGLSVIQRSLSDVSTSSKVDQSARAYFAAEAGIEKTLAAVPFQSPFPLPFSLANNSQVTSIEDSNLIPTVPPAGTRQNPLEYPPLPKEDVVQVWLADLNSEDNRPPAFYTQPTLEVYWGDPALAGGAEEDKAALELTLVYYGTDPDDPIDGSTIKYRNKKMYFDSVTRDPENNFNLINCTGNNDLEGYYCHTTINLRTSPAISMLLRARLLYNNFDQPFAVQAVSDCGQDCSLPPQGRTIVSTGVSGTTQRKVKLYQEYNVVPPEFDYAIFSSGAITK